MAEVIINRRKARRMITAAVVKNMRAVGVFAVGEVKKLINENQPSRPTKSGDSVTYVDPSTASVAPNPPKRLSHALIRSVATETVVRPRSVVTRFGTNTPYGRRLELGYFGTDAKGRNIAQAERPHLRRVKDENAVKFLKIMRRKPK